MRAASGGDVAGIRALDDGWSADVWAAEVGKGNVLVETDADAVVGVISVSRVEDVADLDRIAVHPGRRRGGLGRRLVAQALDRARAAGARRVLLEVEESNGPARALYAATGFAAVARRADYYGPGRHAVVMGRDLGEGA